MHLREQGHKVVLVSSGAIGVGLKRMNMPHRPKSLAGKQASPLYHLCRRVVLVGGSCIGARLTAALRGRRWWTPCSEQHAEREL